MKRGVIIYNQTGAEKNTWFISRMQEELSRFSIGLDLKIFNEQEDFFQALPDFAIVRSILPNVNAELEKRGVRVFNNGETARISCDKWETYLACKRWQIPVLSTCLYGEETQFPRVMKSVDGHGGEEVFWVNSKQDAEKIYQKNRADARYILQKPNDILGEDMRVYAIGGKVVASVLRRSQNNFKSNFSLGGNVQLAQADERQKAIVKRLYEQLKFDYVGIDFLPTKSGWVLNEIEDSAGARMLYACSDIDIVRLYAEYVAKEIV